MKSSAGASATFSPAPTAQDIGSRADMLGRFIPTAIARLPPVARVIPPLRVALYGLCSAGVIPLLQLRTRLNEYISLEHQQLELACELLACHIDPSDAKVAIDAADRVQSPAWTRWISDITLLGAIVAFILAWHGHDWSVEGIRQFYFRPPAVAEPLALAWLGLLSASYLLTYLRINRHIASLQQFALAFNAAVEGRAAPIAIPQFAWALPPLHLIVALVLMLCWSIWALPMMLAWGAYQVFVHQRDYAMRCELSDRLQQLSGVQPVVNFAGLCRNPQCRHPIPDDARFCPQCGEKV